MEINMINVGRFNDLKITEITGGGIYLSDIDIDVEANENKKVYLPKKEIPKGCKIGDVINVFI